MKPISIFLSICALVGVVMLIALNPLVQINEGERGVVLNWGAWNHEPPMKPGLHWRTPIVQDVAKWSTRTQKPVYDKMVAFSFDKQDIFVDVAVNYNMSGDSIGFIYSQFESVADIEAKLIYPSVQQIVKQTFNKLKADEIVRDREKVRLTIREALVSQLAPSHITVTDVFLENIDFSASYKAAIEKAQIAEQQRIEQENITAQEEEKKKQEILKAEALAEKTRLEGQALLTQGDAIIEKIRAEAALAAAQNWNGVLPTHFVPDSTLPIMNIK